MGIPSYFSYIIKNYSNIICNQHLLKELKFWYLFMDCNSIIYDVFRNLNIKDFDNHTDLESKIITEVISKVSEYIYFIRPKDLVYIAFDGVAPFAKMEQQRIRRHKNTSNHVDEWSTSNITPGTNFMNSLSIKMKNAFHN